MCPFIMVEPKREFIYTLKTQQQDGQRQCDQDSPCYQCETEAFGFC